MCALSKAAYNRMYYRWRKEYEKNNKGSYEVNRWEQNRRESNRRKNERNISLYADEQKVIRTARKARGWTQKQLGEMLGVSLQCVCHLEKGRLKAHWDKLYEIMPELKEVHR